MSSHTWLAESFRFSLIGPIMATHQSIIGDFLGLSIAEINEKPAQQLKQETSIQSDYRIIVSKTPSRIDLHVLDLTQSNTTDPSRPDFKPFFEIGSFEQKAQLTLDMAERVLRHATSINRYAYGPIAISIHDDLLQANRFLRAMLPKIDFDPDQDTDIAWQINRPKVSKIASSRVNRLTKWSVLSTHFVQVLPQQLQTLPLDLGSIVGGALQAPQVFNKTCVRLEMDINTMPLASDQFLTAEPTKLAKEFYQMALEVTAHGDI